MEHNNNIIVKIKTIFKTKNRIIKESITEKNISIEERQELEKQYLITHPESVERIRGCCDRADQD